MNPSRKSSDLYASTLAGSMADALMPLSDDELSDLKARLAQYASALSVNDILSLRGAIFRKMDAIARREAADRRGA